ncbi:hypothetical protein IMCC9480_3932 [Oxalobacteraceae bacterium IMCC9480]|nr:hypothetical protein IMCC9480_3932 [Oxalobacteraceae bacterium IMCC9480]
MRHRRHKTHGQEDQIGFQFEFRIRHFLHAAVFPFDARGDELVDLAVLAFKTLGGDGPIAIATFFMRRRGAQLGRPVRPDHRLVFFFRRLRHQLELGHRHGTLAVRGTDAVRTGITATDDDDMLASGENLVLDLVAGIALVLQGQEVHREMHALELATRYRQIARLLGATGDDDGIEVFFKLLGEDGFLGPVIHVGREVLADQHAGAESHAFGLHLLDATVNVDFFHLEVRDAIAQQAADAIALFEHGHIVAYPRQLLCRRHAGRTGADDGDFLAGLGGRRLRYDPAVFPTLVDDEMLDRLDADGVTVDAQGAGALARCRANAAGELGEVIGRVQGLERFAITTAIHHVIPVRNDVVDRAAGIAERNTAIHAARALDLGFGVGQVQREFLVMLGAQLRRFARLFETLKLHEASNFSHDLSRLYNYSC